MLDPMEPGPQAARRISELAEQAIAELEVVRRGIEELLAVLAPGSARDPAAPRLEPPRDGGAPEHDGRVPEPGLEDPTEPPRSVPEEPAVVPLPASLDSARLVAIEMAVTGSTRDEVRIHLRAAYDLDESEAL